MVTTHHRNFLLVQVIFFIAFSQWNLYIPSFSKMHTPGSLLADGLNSLTRGPVRADLRPLKGTVGREAALGTGAGLCSSSAPWPGPCCRRGPRSPVCWQPRFHHRHRRRCQTPMAPSPGACERQLLPQLPLRSRGRGRSLRGSQGRQPSLAPADGAK